MGFYRFKTDTSAHTVLHRFHKIAEELSIFSLCDFDEPFLSDGTDGTLHLGMTLPDGAYVQCDIIQRGGNCLETELRDQHDNPYLATTEFTRPLLDAYVTANQSAMTVGEWIDKPEPLQNSAKLD